MKSFTSPVSGMDLRCKRRQGELLKFEWCGMGDREAANLEGILFDSAVGTIELSSSDEHCSTLMSVLESSRLPLARRLSGGVALSVLCVCVCVCPNTM
jgi:hypothetical protein